MREREKEIEKISTFNKRTIEEFLDNDSESEDDEDGDVDESESKKQKKEMNS